MSAAIVKLATAEAGIDETVAVGFETHGGAHAAALARLMAERALLGAHAAEYRAVAPRGGHAEAVRRLVQANGREYVEAYRRALQIWCPPRL